MTKRSTAVMARRGPSRSRALLLEAIAGGGLT
jgi:hypothetical protein